MNMNFFAPHPAGGGPLRILRLDRLRRNGKLHVRILLGVTVCIVLALIAASSVYYLTFMRILQKEINGIIAARYADPKLGLNYIADALDMSVHHISRVYRQHTLTPIVDVINEYRIAKAKELLCRTNLPISEIAGRTGYTNTSYFHRKFKQLNGVTPAEFRKSNRAAGCPSAPAAYAEPQTALPQ